MPGYPIIYVKGKKFNKFINGLICSITKKPYISQICFIEQFSDIIEAVMIAEFPKIKFVKEDPVLLEEVHKKLKEELGEENYVPDGKIIEIGDCKWITRYIVCPSKLYFYKLNELEERIDRQLYFKFIYKNRR